MVELRSDSSNKMETHGEMLPYSVSSIFLDSIVLHLLLADVEGSGFDNLQSNCNLPTTVIVVSDMLPSVASLASSGGTHSFFLSHFITVGISIVFVAVLVVFIVIHLMLSSFSQ